MFEHQTISKLSSLLAAALAMTGCTAAQQAFRVSGAPPSLAQSTPSQRELFTMPVPAQPIPIAVYDFTDQTGQLKPSDSIQSLSRAVTQGGASMVVQSLRDAGDGRWFTVVERERLDNLLKERQIIREMRNRYLGEKDTPAEVLPSLLFAGIVLEGGIIGYDTNLKTGGIGARFLAIGASTQYRQNSVTIYLRAVSVKTGEVLASVVTHKSIVSVSLNASTFKFVTFDELLEAEAGVSVNEPTQIAVQSAIEKAVYALIMEGAQAGPRHLWSFSDSAAGSAALARYAAEKARSNALTRVTFPVDSPKDQPKVGRAHAQ